MEDQKEDDWCVVLRKGVLGWLVGGLSERRMMCCDGMRGGVLEWLVSGGSERRMMCER